MKTGRQGVSFHQMLRCSTRTMESAPVTTSELILNLGVFHFNEYEIMNKMKIQH